MSGAPSMKDLSVTGDTTARDTPGIRHLTLWAAVLRRAVLDWTLYKDSESLRERKTYWNAHNWLFSDVEEFPSFVVLCHHLGADPDFVRERLLELTPEEVRALRGVDFGNGG